ncbi:serine/threonine protein phosphatase [Saccharophagus sp. K07]|jgi:diadenosine tetraphosphatase ApaH/serine/threonine PP2A family protein phosphatase|uniref:metallophosphoesterase n=1 Tax=Saccharophagus sp. K07 TaxID=2283636 RepID=UPI0016525F2F|nr:metallophosphoesterase [Saccharophagus sp. K07]MBC6904796.1 serine/threonine protein phosphatase [Saccharophagus sp. K07]
MTGQERVWRGYDIIGDVHGCAFTLEKLLHKLGYERVNGVYQHPERQAIFVGDIVDRGPHIREALHLVKAMTDAGVARCVMGNHEFNAICYTTPAPPETGQTHVRAHTQRHNRLIAETLAQLAAYPEEWRMFLEWFKTLPLFLELPGFRVVHACWDHKLIDEYKSRYGSGLFREELIVESMDSNSFAGRVFDRLTRGTGIPLPEGTTIIGRDGYVRDSFRTKFWAENPQTYRDVVFQPDPLPEYIADRPLSPSESEQLLRYGTDEPPVFVGHYWLQGTPKPLRPNVACLDYSAVKFGRLVAYRFDGESKLSPTKFVWVYVDPES